MKTVIKANQATGSEPVFSVIIVVKNEEQTLPRLLRMLEKQTFDRFEVIIIDNGSTDTTPLVIKEAMRMYDYPIISGVHYGTLAEAYNEGLKYASGEYVAIIGGDEVPGLDWLAAHYECLTGGCDACLAPVVFAPPRGPVSRWYYNRSILEILYNKESFHERVVFNSGNLSVKTPIIKKLKFYPPMTVSEDGEFSYRFIKHGYKVCFTDKGRAYHPPPRNMKQHLSFWWKLAYANYSLQEVHPYSDLKKVFIRNLFLAHLDPREFVKSSLFKSRGIFWSTMMHLTALLSMASTYFMLRLTQKSTLWRPVQRIK